MEYISETVLGLWKQPHDLGVGELCVRAAIIYLVMILLLRNGEEALP